MANILASKLFISSRRKDKILSAIKDPVNSELVTQVRSYLDDEFIDPKYLDPDGESSENTEDFGRSSEDNSSEGFETPQIKDTSSNPSINNTGVAGIGENFLDSDSLDSDSLDSSDSLDVDSFNEPPEDEDIIDPVEESVSIEPIDSSKHISDIQELLNSREDCKGVLRVIDKGEELWIYYIDDINLNGVMISVINALEDSGYNYLEFSRLARSSNAIVFDILSRYEDVYNNDGGGNV